jgi:hypothetical protein
VPYHRQLLSFPTFVGFVEWSGVGFLVCVS